MWPWSKRDDDGEELPEFGGTWIVAMGPPRSGKTHAASTLAFHACLRWGLPLLAQDPTGNLHARVQGYAEAANERRRLKSKAERELGEAEYEFFSDRRRCTLYSGKDTSKLLDAIERYVGDGKRSADEWQAVVLLDEGAIIRALNPAFFDSIAPLFGNAGLLGYVTEQREVGVPPSVRACIRAYLLWQGPTQRTEVFDRSIETSQLTKPRSHEIVYLDTLTGELKTWDQATDPALELITPAKLSRPVKQSLLR